MPKYWVYIHTCPNGKKYVGVTSQENPEERWGTGGRHYCRQLFWKAIKKYGWENIIHEVFEVGSEEEMYQKEIELIAQFRSNNPEYGYNVSLGGDHSTRGTHHSLSLETRLKMSRTKKSTHGNSTTWKKGQEPWNKGKKLTTEHKAHLRKPKAKKLWLTLEGERVEMCEHKVKKYHPEWKEL